MSVRIETDRLIVRAFVPDDAPALIAVAGQPHIEFWLPDWREADRWAASWIEMVNRHYELDDPQQKFLAFAVELKCTNDLIGMINVGKTDKGFGVGYFIAQEHLNKGYATEAMRAFAAWIFARYGYDRLIATVQPGNIASNHVVQKLGFVHDGTAMMLDCGQTQELPFHLYHLDNPNAASGE